MKWVDFHCHIDLYEDPRALLRACASSEIEVFAVSTIPGAAERLEPVAHASGATVHVGVGLHPELAHEHHTQLDRLLASIRTHRFVGEIGLDASPQYRDYRAIQRHVFEAALAACESSGGRIISIHSRRAARGVLDLLAKYPGAGLPVLHWFSGTFAELSEAVMAGCWFSVGLAMLQSGAGRDIVAAMPRNRVLTETDGPFARDQGIPLRPTDVKRTVGGLASLWEVPVDEVKAMIWRNYQLLLSTV